MKVCGLEGCVAREGLRHQHRLTTDWKREDPTSVVPCGLSFTACWAAEHNCVLGPPVWQEVPTGTHIPRGVRVRFEGYGRICEFTMNVERYAVASGSKAFVWWEDLGKLNNVVDTVERMLEELSPALARGQYRERAEEIVRVVREA